MKTIKLVLVLAFVSFAVTAFASEQPSSNPPLTVKISLEKALNDQAMAWEMMKHLNTDFLAVEKKGYYSTELMYRHNMYVIYGKYQEWMSFFELMKWRKAKAVSGCGAL